MSTRRRTRATRYCLLVGVIAACALAPSAPARDLTQREIDRCNQGSPLEDAIAACTAVITSGRWSDKELGWAYYIRGVAYRRRGEYSRSVVDLTNAIRADPGKVALVIDRGNTLRANGELDRAIDDFTNAIDYCGRGQCARQTHAAAYGNRADVWRDKGDNARALADFAEAIRLDPKTALIYENRARVELYAGSLPQALADLAQASELDPKRGYTALWLEIAGRRSGQPSTLADAIRQVDMSKWPGPIISLYLGQTTPEGVLAVAENPDPVIKRGRVCEVNFYVGELALQHGAKDEALRLLRLAAADCPRHYTEWWTANAELKAVAANP